MYISSKFFQRIRVQNKNVGTETAEGKRGSGKAKKTRRDGLQ